MATSKKVFDSIDCLKLVLLNPQKLFYDSLFESLATEYKNRAIIAIVCALNTL